MPAGATGRPDDSTPPEVTPVLYGTLGANGWYISNVTLNWIVTDPESPISESHGCDAITFRNDTVGTQVTCSATSDGGTTTKSVTIKLDKTAPFVTASPARPPDANGWYNSPLTVAFSGTDATSQIASCTQATYAGPDTLNTAVSGSCGDNAGNQTAASYALKYDATPPAVSALRVTPKNGAAKLNWNVQGATSIQVVRAPGLKGAAESVVFKGAGSTKSYIDRKLRPGRQYEYRLTATDAAANQALKTLEYLARGALLFPAPGERVKKPPLLVWTPKRGASYYNVVLVRGRRVLSEWPVQARLQLGRSWKYHGRRNKLRPGTYTWFVWPGYGPLSAGRYGKLLGGSTFTFGGSG